MAIYKLKEILASKPIYGAGLKALGNGRYKYFRQSDFKSGPTKFVNETHGKIMKKGDFFISRAGTIETYYHNTNEKIVFAGYLVKYEINEKMAITKYVYYWSKSNGKKQISKYCNSGSTMPIFNPPLAINSLKINLPSIKIQKQIIDIIEPIERTILKLNNLATKINALCDKYTKIDFQITNEKYEYHKGFMPSGKGQTIFLNVAAANGNVNRLVSDKPNIFPGDITLSLDGNTGIVNRNLIGYNGYLFKVTSQKYANYEIFFALKHSYNQKTIKLNETGTTIKHSPRSKKEIVHIKFKNKELLFKCFQFLNQLDDIIAKLTNIQTNLITLLVK